MLSTTRLPKPTTRLPDDKLAVLIRQAVQASRVHKALGEDAAAVGYLELARTLLDWRIEAMRAGV